MKTRSIKKKEIEAKWFIVDASNIRLGKLASKVASVLIGKNDILRADNLEPMTNVIVVNSEKVDIFPTKVSRKLYQRHSGYPGGFKERTYEQMMDKFPEKVIQLAVKRMLPQTRMGAKMFRRLHAIKGTNHKFEAQKPIELKVK